MTTSESLRMTTRTRWRSSAQARAAMKPNCDGATTAMTYGERAGARARPSVRRRCVAALFVVSRLGACAVRFPVPAAGP